MQTTVTCSHHLKLASTFSLIDFFYQFELFLSKNMIFQYQVLTLNLLHPSKMLKSTRNTASLFTQQSEL